jgi:phospholipase C
MKLTFNLKKGWRATTALTAVSGMLFSTVTCGAQTAPPGFFWGAPMMAPPPFLEPFDPPVWPEGHQFGDTVTPIKHVIILIGENRGLDHTFGIYRPKGKGQFIANLLSKGIVNEDGSPGPNFWMATQFSVAAQPSYYVGAPDSAKHPYNATNVMPLPQITEPPVTQSVFSPPFSPNQFNPAHPELNFVDEKDVEPGVLTLTNNANILTTGFSGQKVAACALSAPVLAALASASGKVLGPLVLDAQAPVAPLTAAQLSLLLPKCSGPDVRIPAIRTSAPSGPFPLWGAAATDIGDDDYTSDQTHRFFQDWQQEDCRVAHATWFNPSGCRNDLFPFVTSAATMGFYNMEKGQVPVLKMLADKFTLSDNFHQSFHGGTYANHVMLGTGDAIFWNDGNGNPTTPPAGDIANPNPQPGTVNTYTVDGNFSACTVNGQPQPGAEAVLKYLSGLYYHPKPNCQDQHYYMINNTEPAYLPDGTIGVGFRNTPSLVRTIGDELSEKNISWVYYGGAWNDLVFLVQAAKALGVNPTSVSDLINVILAGGLSPSNAALSHALGAAYCTGCNPFMYSKSIMENPAARQEHLKDTTDLIAAIENNTLPAVSFGKPDGLLDGHPQSSKTDLFEAYVFHLLKALDANPALRAETAVFITWDEAGGYWDSGYIQPLDYFGDGPRMPLLVLSPYSTGGKIHHGYGDHVSLLKFIERNWRLRPLTHRSRDNLPNPVTVWFNPYVPLNSPAITDLFDAFDFWHQNNIAYTE